MIAVQHKIKISIDDILEKYDCPICMCKLSDPYISKCGHTFCKVNFLFNAIGVHIWMC